jgi:hypothetical protein
MPSAESALALVSALLLYMRPHTTTICVLILLLHMCPHTTTKYVSSYYYYICPHTNTIHVSSYYYYICVLILLLYMCPPTPTTMCVLILRTGAQRCECTRLRLSIKAPLRLTSICECTRACITSTTTCVRILLHVSSYYYYTCVLRCPALRGHMCPHTTTMCPHTTTIYVSSLYMCTQVSSATRALSPVSAV